MNIFRIASLGIIAAMGVAFEEPDTAKGAESAPAVAKPTGLTILTDETKLEKIGKHLSSVKIFQDKEVPNPEKEGETMILSAYDQALAYLESGAKETENFYGLPVAAAGDIDEEGNLDTSIYEGMRVRVGTLSARTEVGKTKKNGLKAITILPIPSLEAIMADPNGNEFLDKIIAKELGLVSYRNIRDASTESDLLAGMAKSPRSVAEYLAESKRAGTAGDTETFDALWRGLRDSLKEAMPALAKMLPSKVEIIKAIRSKAYALAEYNELETAPKGSVFIKLANAVIQNARENTTDGKPAPLDTGAIESWIAGRDELTLSKRGPEVVDYSGLAEMDFGGFGDTSGNSAEA